MKWYLQALKKYAVFSGRARRLEYWEFFAFNALLGIAVNVILTFTATTNVDGTTSFSTFGMALSLLYIVYALFVVIPTVAVSVRRLHDTDRSGWWFLIVLIPFIGGLVFLVFALLDGTPGNNRYGPNPKSVNNTNTHAGNIYQSVSSSGVPSPNVAINYYTLCGTHLGETMVYCPKCGAKKALPA